MFKKLTASVVLVIIPLFANADYPSALPNNNVGKEIAAQEDRLITKSIDWFSASVDGHSYLRTLGTKDFYHGVGYWIQARSEFRPNENFNFNVRSVFYSGSVSGGYTEPTGNYHLVGLYGLWPHEIFGGNFEGRAMDLERQTIGNGLFIEQKEIAGLWFKWSRNGHYFKLLGDGTGGLVLDDDLVNTEFQLFGGLIGGGGIFWANESDRLNFSARRKPYYYITSSYEFAEGFKYLLEAGSRNEKYAALLAFETDHNIGCLNLQSKLQGRYYDDRFGDEFVGSIEHMYISYDQYDKNFTNTANVFVVDDNAYVYSLILNLRYKFNDDFEAHLLNEVGQFDYKATKADEFYFYRAGFTYFPLPGRKESVTLFASNKVLTDSYQRPPSSYSSANVQLFHEVSFVGFEAAFRF